MNPLYRLVTEQDGSTHISSVVLTEDEAKEALGLEALMHGMTGWMVIAPTGCPLAEFAMVCIRGEVSRLISVIKVNESEAIHERL